MKRRSDKQWYAQRSGMKRRSDKGWYARRTGMKRWSDEGWYARRSGMKRWSDEHGEVRCKVRYVSLLIPGVGLGELESHLGVVLCMVKVWLA